MENVWFVASIWVGLALIATLIAIWLKLSTALSEIIVGTVAQLVIGTSLGPTHSPADRNGSRCWPVRDSILLTFLAGAELDPTVFRLKWKEATVVGLAGFFAPFLGCTMIARFMLHWAWPASRLAGVALSTTSVAVVYAVMFELMECCHTHDDCERVLHANAPASS